MSEQVVRVKARREKSLARRHPWIFTSALERLDLDIPPGDTVVVQNDEGHFLARGAYSPHSRIRVRVWSWDEQEEITPVFFRHRIESALIARDSLNKHWQSNAYRLIHGESDGLPGLVVDRYAEVLVVQFLSAGAERWREILVDLLVEMSGLDTVYERSDVDVRLLEGLPLKSGLLRGKKPDGLVRILENGFFLGVDVENGQKTGFYLDQKINRSRLRSFSTGREVLDCFAYTGGFSLSAIAGGAERVVAIESNPNALEIASFNVLFNQLPEDRVEWIEGDVFKVLRSFRDQNRKFDLIILDPPKYAPTISQAQKAARAYKDINLLAFKLLRSGGILFTFSCSGGVSADLFQKIVAGAALDAGVEAQILEHLEQAPDHPVALNFPEGAYLKGLILRVI